MAIAKSTFYTLVWKKRSYYVITRGGRRVKRCPLSNSNKYFSICFKLWDNVYGHNISAKFDNELYRKRRSRVMPPYLWKFHEIDDVRSLTQTNIFRFASNFGIMFMVIISRPSSIMSNIGWVVPELCPLKYKISRNWLIIAPEGRILCQFVTLV